MIQLQQQTNKVPTQSLSKMDEYEAKFADMQKFIPFLEAMIERLKKVKDQSRASQLQKLQSLHGILTDNSKRKLNFDLLLRCEDVLQNLHSKVEKGHPAIPKPQSTKSTDDTRPNSSGLLEPKIECTTDNKSIEDNEMRNKIGFVKNVRHDETPASPSPPASPDQATDSTNVKPIIIPTERSDGFTGVSTDDRPASPDACEMIASIGPRTPIIIPTERECPNPLRNVDPDPINQRIPTWTYPEGIPSRAAPMTNLWQTSSASRGTGSRPRVIRHIPTMPIPSKGSGCVLKKPVLILDKGRNSPEPEIVEASGGNFDVSSISESRLHSPDRDAHLPRPVKTSPKVKDLPPLPKMSTTSLLASPPPVLTIPPLTSEDLAELLQDESEKQDHKKSEISEKPSDTRKTGTSGGKDETRKPFKETERKASARASPSKSKKDEKSSKNSGPTPMDVDRDGERCREEGDRPVAKVHSHETGRRRFTSPPGQSAKHTESRASSSSSSASTERPTDPRNRPPSPGKDRHRASSEVRYADNYEKHPRQSRDNHKPGPQSDSNPMNSAFSRNSEVDARATSEERGSTLYHRRNYSSNGSYQELDPRREKSVEFYKSILQREREREREREQDKQREREREIQRERERELQRERERDLQRERDIEREILNQGSNRGMIHHSPGRGGDICNQNQWGPNPNYPPGPQGPMMYPQQQQRPDRWMQPGPNNLPVDMMGPQQYQGPPNSCGRPMLSPQDMNMGGPCMDNRNMGPCMDMNIGARMDQGCMDMNMGPRMDPDCGDMNFGGGPCMDPGFRDDMNNMNMGPQPMGLQQHPNAMPGMMPQQGYPMGSQYHQFPQDNRPNVQQFDRPQDFPQPRPSWDPPGNIRSNDNNLQYPRCQGPPQGQWNRPNRASAPVGAQIVPPPLITPPSVQPVPPAQTNRNFNERGRGPESSRNSSSYNRDPRDSRDHRDSRDPRDPREPRDSRDPRVRPEAPTNAQNVNTSVPGPPANSRREFSRFSKDTPQLPSHSSKTRDNNSSSIDRNQRRRANESKETNKHSASKEKEMEREHNRKREEKKRDSKNDKKNDKESNANKSVNEKLSKDVMQSPLESLYGVIDTTAKTGKGYGIQKFKIPKKRKVDPAPSKTVDDVIEEIWDAPDENQDCVITNEKLSDVIEIPRGSRRKETEEKKSEVTSTTGESTEDRQALEDSSCTNWKETPAQSRLSEKLGKKPSPESGDQIVDTSTKSVEHSNAASKGNEVTKVTEEVTQELIQALIRKSLQSGEVTELLEAKLREKFGEAFQGKKFKKILDIIESDSSGSSDAEEPTENKKTGMKKKRRVIVSDSSEDECLAERLDKIDTVENNEPSLKSSRPKETTNTGKGSGGKSSTASNIDKDLDEDARANKATESSKDGASDKQESSNKTGRSNKRQKRRERRKSNAAGQQAMQTSEPVAEPKEQQANEKLNDPPKSGKPKPRRRNSLEMLQEDIREMFISQGVVTATGHRMCRLIKEAQENLTGTVESQAKKASGSLDRQSARNESDFEEEIQRPHSVNSKARRGRGNGRRGQRQRCRTKIQKSVKEIPTSDSETEDSVRTEVSALNDTNDIDKNVDVSAKSDNINSSKSSSSKDDADGLHFLRRSERVGLRDSGKGTRNHDKSNKMDSSKTMFDSSSDESFGIDVSELAAAVDISLHPESRGRITSSPVAKGSASIKSKRQKGGKSRENSSGKTDKTDNVASADEVESIASDLSRTSSLTRGKKANSSCAKQDTNDELMSDLLIGLDNSKIPGNKSVDGDGSDMITGQANKAGGRRRKKKKPSWAMGIVKKKKKKIPSPAPTPSIEGETSTTDRSLANASFDETGRMNVELKEEILSDVSPSKGPSELADAVTKEARVIVQKSEPISPTKSISSHNTSINKFEDTSEGEKQLDELLMDDKGDEESDSLAQTKPKIFSTEELLKYLWLPKQDRFSCLYCPWNGKNIVHHYALSHGTQELLISRLTIEQSNLAKEEALTGAYDQRLPNTETKDTRKFLCRFCTFQTVGATAIAIEAFYEHCTTHTGEYRFRCRGCTYRTVARSSMRTHCSRKRNNPCRGDYANTSMAFIGDPVPDDDILYGYLCTACNFVQLKESNVVEHVKLQHATSAYTEILKIDMSSHEDNDLYSDDIKDIKDTKPELKLEDDLQAGTDGGDNSVSQELGDLTSSLTNVTGTITCSIDIDEENLKNENLKEEDVTDVAKPTNEPMETETASAPQEITNGNLNAFVCPPEVENKEFEIQLERQKKMQEVVENIGLSSNLNEKRDLSILEKLKEKMTENIGKDSEEAETGEAEIPVEINLPTEEPASVNLPILLPESVTSLAPGTDSTEQVNEPSEDAIKKEPEESVGDLSKAPKDEIDSDTGDKSEKKMKDPLANLEEGHKDDSSGDDEDSDVETIPEQPPSYESDTSTEQSDSEIPADVNSLLEETFSINKTSNAPMMTTIQRLAAKLQSEKPFVAAIGNSVEEKSEDNDQQQASDGIIPKKPNAIPISSIQRFLDRRNAMLQEVVKEVADVGDKDSMVEGPPSSPKSSVVKAPTPVASPPKKFIRLRRLSGDKLSVPGPVETSAVITPLEVPRVPSLGVVTSQAIGEILQTECCTEECSFLRIENVVSLAPGIEKNPLESTLDDVRKSVTTLKSSGPISLLRKSTSNILKRPIPPGINITATNLPMRSVGAIPIGNLQVKAASGLQSTYIPIRPAPTPAISVPIKSSGAMPTSPVPTRAALAVPIASGTSRPATAQGVSLPSVLPVSPSSGKNFKLVKVVRGLTLLKQKDSTHRIYGNTLKTPDAFNAMLQPAKLRQFYKCMARSCTYTTDCQQSFGLHYRQHKENVDRTKGVISTYDFQRCPYCTETFTAWNAMSEHLKDKHIYCQYQCHYCFYRAIAQSYVELHQLTVHQGVPPSVLVGQKENPPVEVIDRREFVIPFVCDHECGKSFYVPGAFLGHLRTKHGNSLSIFKCHLCPAPSFKAETLIAHYKLHGIYKFQCLYCLFGSEQAADVHAHLSASHYNRPPHVLERSLQPRPVRDKDVIQQLIVLNVDENYKCSELSLSSGQDPSDLPKNKTYLQVDRNLGNESSSAVAELTVPMGNIGMGRHFSYDKSESNESATAARPVTPPINAVPIIAKIRKISPMKSAENILIVGDKSIIRKIPKQKDSIIVETLTSVTSSSHDSIQPNSSSVINAAAASLLASSSNRRCSDEFLNVNILDNPEILKDVAPQSRIKIPPAKPVQIDDDDSDIEILEDIKSPQRKPKPNNNVDTKPVFVAVKEEGTVLAEAETPTVAETNPSRPFDLCSSNENSSDATITANQTSTGVDDTSNRPLTLDDIRDTGFTGSQLYRCGYDGCEFGADTSALLRTHIKECSYASETKSLNCVHCSKRFMQIGFLVEHFKFHGLKRFGCSMCKGRWPMSYQAMSHMKSKHKQTYTKLIPADPKNPSAEGLFIVEPIPTNGTCRKKRGRVKSSEKEEKPDTEKTYYGPADIESLPRPAIYPREVHCAVCSYTTKVRTNIMRHLQLHAEDKSVPESGPVNPVPCLDKKERMFDKMVNLASSSHQNGRMSSTKSTKEPAIDTDAESLPKFIPENRRYVCGVTDCNYVSLNETMLRCHLKALHSDELYFRCPHCPSPAPGHETQNVAIDKMAVHLKMHDSRLYKCSHCNNHHFHRHVVERHLSDKHPDVNPYVKVIREPENTENVQQSGNQDETQGDEAPTDDGYHWKCNLCEYKCSYKAEMGSHALSVHEEKGQFKCNACSYKTNNKISFEQHLNAKHPYDLNAECFFTYEKMKGSMKKAAPTENTETNNLDEPFDTTPLWRRDMPRVRHIRGILFEDEKPEGKSSKRKSDVEPSAKPAKIKSSKSATSDSANLLKDIDPLSTETVSPEKAEPTLDIAESFREGEPGSSTFTTVDIAKLIRKFGPLGSPIAVFYRCTICQTFKTKYKHDMRDHLYRDLKYWRYRCQLCGYMGVNKTASLKHFERNHEPRRPTEQEQTILPVDHELETWVQALLKSQSNQMRGFPTGADGNALQDVKYRRSNSTNARRSSAENLQSPTKDQASKKSKTTDPTTSKTDENLMVDEILIDVESNDSNDFDAIAIDNKEDFDNEELIDDASGTNELKVSAKLPITCKYCNVKLSTLRGFKLHVEIRHLRRRKFLCVYCDTSLNTETNMRKHLKVVHPGETATIHQNPEADSSELTMEFWDKEYKFMSRDRAKKRKRNEEGVASIDPFEKTPGVFHICNTCGFRAINYFGLTVHMRRHATSKNFKCAYCSYAACTKSELWQHSELNHSNEDWKVGNGDLNIVDKCEIKKNSTSGKDPLEEADYEDETASTSETSGSLIVAKSDMMYSCFYCDSGNSTVDGIEEHWNLVHKSTPGMPFRFKEIPFDSTKNTLRCGYCPKRGTAAQIRLHARKKHAGKPVKFVEIPLVPIAWVCQWCEDLCDTEAQKKVHHNLFHSHKLPNFKRQEINTEASPRHECPECPFKAISRPAMEKHLEKHVDSVICKRCDKTFRDVSIGILHNTKAHPGEVSKIEGFKTNVEKMMTRVKWRNDVNQDRNTFETVARSALENTWKNCGVARKSTTKSIISVRPSPKSVKAVARKSTNPLPRYPPGIKFLTSEDSNDGIRRERNISYYGKPVDPVNLSSISTYMTLSGGRRMKVDCSSLAQFIDIEPSVIINDLKYNTK